MDAEVMVGTRIPRKDKETLDKIVEDDIQWSSRSHLVRSIIHYWCEEQRDPQRTTKEGAE